jgi:hypothetical protein
METVNTLSTGSGTIDHNGSNIAMDAAGKRTNLQVLEQELEEFAARHGMPNADRRRNPLSPRHVKDFDGSTLFDEFARAVCMADVIPRKELFEAWAMASYVHKYFPKSRRIADLACSHGLLSWALLLMASADSSSSLSSASSSSSSSLNEDYQEGKQSEDGQQRTVICIDKSMPRSSERVQLAMTKRWPELADRWDYVEGSLEGTVPAPSTLLVGVHCCGILSDKVIDLAIQGQAPLALVPCCHSKQCLSRKDREIFETTVMNTKNKGKDDCYATATSNFIDNLRMERLKSAGFTTQEARIPSAFTPKNRLILALPPKSSSQINTSPPPPPPSETTATTMVQEESKTESHRAIHADWQTKLFCIPISDDPVARATIKSLAGRAAANQRKEPPPRSFSLSLYIPTKDYVLSLDKLNHVANQVVSSALVSPNRPPPPKQKQKNHQQFQQSLSVEVQVEQLYDSGTELKGGKFGRTYRVLYQHGKAKSTGETITEDGGGTRRPMCKEWAKQLHYELCLVLPKEFPDVVVRQLPR